MFIYKISDDNPHLFIKNNYEIKKNQRQEIYYQVLKFDTFILYILHRKYKQS